LCDDALVADSKCHAFAAALIVEAGTRFDSTDAMKTHRSPSPSPAAAHLVPPALIPLIASLRSFFTARVWDHVLVLVAGTILAPGKRTVPCG